MNKNHLNRFKSRRRFIKKAGFTALASQLPTSVIQASLSNNEFKLANLSQQVIQRAKELKNNRAVTLTILQPQGSLGNVKPVGELFQKQTGIGVKYIESSLDEINAKILAQSVSNQNDFDISLPATFGLPDLIESKVIINLDKYVEVYEPKDFKNGMLYSIGDSYKGSFYGYQTDGDTYLMFYNKQWLEDEKEKNAFKNKYGYELAIPKTWNQLDQMIEFFHRPAEDKFGGALFRNKDYIAWEWWTRFHAKGYFPFDEKLNPQINTAAGINALEELINTSKNLYPHAASNDLFGNWEAFAEGNIFCNIGWGGTQKYLNNENSKMRDNLVFSPSPGGYVNNELLSTPYFNWGWNYTISSKSKEPELAYLFSLFACSPEMSTLAVQFQDGYFDPFRIEHYEDTKIKEVYTTPFLDAHKLSMQESIPDLYLKGQGDYWDVLKENLSLANKGRLSPQLALDATAKVWKQISRRFGINSQLEQWQHLKSQYPKNIRGKLI